MSAAIDLPVPAASRPSPGTLRPWGELHVVFNGRSIALVFYFVLALVLARTMAAAVVVGAEEFVYLTARLVRQNLISGYTLLLAVELLQAFATVRGWTLRRTLRLGLPAIVAATAIGALLRLVVAGVEWHEMPGRAGWGLGVVALWTAIGMLGLAITVATRQAGRAREALADARCERDTLAAQHLQARLSALQAQIEPHFLFNTLANVKRLYETVPDRGRQMLTHLIAYLRAALPTMRGASSTVEREAELARSYLTILQMRMGDRLRFTIDIDPALRGAAMPPLVLATLLENAIKHGLAPLPEGGSIAIVARRDGDALVLEVRDDGAGFSGSGGSGVGLANTRSRLAALHGDRATLSLAPNQPRGVVAAVRIPIVFERVAPGRTDAPAAPRPAPGVPA